MPLQESHDSELKTYPANSASFSGVQRWRLWLTACWFTGWVSESMSSMQWWACHFLAVNPQVFGQKFTWVNLISHPRMRQIKMINKKHNTHQRTPCKQLENNYDLRNYILIKWTNRWYLSFSDIPWAAEGFTTCLQFLIKQDIYSLRLKGGEETWLVINKQWEEHAAINTTSPSKQMCTHAGEMLSYSRQNINKIM